MKGIGGTSYAVGGNNLVEERATLAAADLAAARASVERGEKTPEQADLEYVIEFEAACARDLANVRAGRKPWENA